MVTALPYSGGGQGNEFGTGGMQVRNRWGTNGGPDGICLAPLQTLGCAQPCDQQWPPTFGSLSDRRDPRKDGEETSPSDVSHPVNSENRRWDI